MSQFSSQSTLAPAEHQREYTQGQIIKFDVPAFYGMIDPRQSFLRMNIELVGDCKLRLSKQLGSQSLISALRIYDHSNAQLLENIENYGELAKIMNVYGDNETLKHQRQLLEAVDTETALGHLDLQNALFFKQLPPLADTTTDLVASGSVNANRVQVAMRLMSGILGGDKVFPINAFGGLRVEIELNRAVKTVMMAEYGALETNCPTLGAEIPAGEVEQFFLKQLPETLPFSVGNEVTIKDDLGVEVVVKITGIARSLIPDSVEYGSRITCDAVDIADCGIGSKVFFGRDVIDSMTKTLDFKLTNVEMCLKQVNPPQSYVSDMVKQMGSDEGLSIDIRTYDLVRNNIINGQKVNEQPIRSFSNRVYSILTVLTPNDSDTLETDSFASLSAGLQSYAYAIDGQLNPNRAVETQLTTLVGGTHINQQSTFELQKGLESCGLTVRNLPVRRDFLIARAVGRYGGVFNLRERNLTLRTTFEPATPSMLCLNYLCSLRRLNVSNSGIVVTQ